MQDRPSVSIIVPFHNSARTLGACLEALVGQKNVDGTFEIIMIDNRSTDESAAIVRRHPQVILLDEPTPGAYTARNRGLRAARASVIAFTDADCVADATWLRAILDAMADPRTAIAIGHCRYPATASLALRCLGAYENAKTDYVVNCCHAAHHFAYANNMAIKEAVFAELGLFETWPRAADSELVHRLARHRPDLRLAYRPSMRVTHLEFERARDRARRLRLYTRTNANIEGFRELGFKQRFGALMNLIFGSRSRAQTSRT